MHMTKRIIIVAMVCVLAASIGCAKKRSPGDDVLVKVSDSAITVNDFTSRIARMPAYYRVIVEKDRKHYLEEMIVEKLFYEDAVRKGLNRDKEVIAVIDDAKKKIVIAKLIKDEVDGKVVVTDQEIDEYYQANRDQFKTPQMWRASHILLATDKDARDVLDALSKGEKFEDIARTRSMDATASRGGDIGYFRIGQLVPDFEKACLALKVGQVSDVVHTQFGYHVITLTDKRDSGIEPLEKVKGRIINELTKKKRIELFDTLVKNLKKRYGVEIREDIFNSIAAKNTEEPKGEQHL